MQGVHHRLDVGGSPGQRGALLLQPAVALLALGGNADLVQQRRQCVTLVPDDLAEVQVQALDSRRALVQAVDLGVPDVLLHGVVLQVA